MHREPRHPRHGSQYNAFILFIYVMCKAWPGSIEISAAPSCPARSGTINFFFDNFSPQEGGGTSRQLGSRAAYRVSPSTDPGGPITEHKDLVGWVCVWFDVGSERATFSAPPCTLQRDLSPVQGDHSRELQGSKGGVRVCSTPWYLCAGLSAATVMDATAAVNRIAHSRPPASPSPASRDRGGWSAPPNGFEVRVV